MAKAFSRVAGYRPAPTSTDSNQVCFAGQELVLAATDLTLNRLIGDVRLPKGAEILGAYMKADDLDSGAALMLSLGDGVDPARYLAASNVGQAGGLVSTLVVATFGLQLTDEALVQIKVTAAPAGGVAGSIKYGILYVSQ